MRVALEQSGPVRPAPHYRPVFRRVCPGRFKHQGIVGFQGGKLLLEGTLTDAAIYLTLYSLRPDNDNTVAESIYSYTLGIHIRKGHYTLSSSFNNDSKTQGF